MVSLNIMDINKRYNGSCNTFDDLPSRICVPNKTEDVNLNELNTTGINESKTLTKHFLCSCGCKFDCNSNQKQNNEICQCECKKTIKHHEYKKIFCLES